MTPDSFDRRTFIGRTAAATTGTLVLAGCAEPSGENGAAADDGTDAETDEDVEVTPEFVEVENPPEAVYVPTHREAMRLLDPIEAGDVAIAPMLTYPHSFWIVAGGGEGAVERVDPEAGHGVHAMFTVWDRETGVVLPVDDGARLRVFRDGEPVGSPRSPWTMISQRMGFHFGDNVSLPGDGTYTVEVELPPLSTRLTGELEGRLADIVTAEFEFTYDEAFREAVVDGVEYLDEELWGQRGALEPMDHGSHGHGDDHDGHGGDGEEHDDHSDGHGGDQTHDDDHEIPYSQLPRVEEYPGTLLHGPDGDEPEDDADLPRSGDAAFVVALLEDEPGLSNGDDAYLLVSPRTPYNRVPLADMAMSATIGGDGETTAEHTLEQTIDGEYDLHYGAAVPEIEPGDAVRIEIESPPQVARHRGYETAFLEIEPIELEVPAE